MIKVNDKIPAGELQQLTSDGMNNLSTDYLFADKKVVLFAVPGAFTPTCSEAHLPGYVVKYDDFKAKGVDTIICVSVNDAFVMSAWGKSQNAENILMLGDGDATFTKSLGLEMDTASFGGIRSQRYAMVVDHGVVTHLNVEAAGKFEVSDAETILALL
ncbi:peroxiredoxin [Thalassotalea sp. PS06]|uniref:peroxiredoxin n=1 Tax=Thalassotalea sp. PS06 TaxID=2594005 RepID=UPI001163DF77|nr:peroxiredoxin [Thalassotalea sp. PS06]